MKYHTALRGASTLASLPFSRPVNAPAMPVAPAAAFATVPARFASTRARVTTSATSAPTRPWDVEGAPSAKELMFCFQCEQTSHGTGCTKVGVCGKMPETTVLQDLLIYQLTGLAAWAHLAHKHGISTPEVDSFYKGAVFSTLTNVNFDDQRFVEYLKTADCYRGALEAALKEKGITEAPAAPALPWCDLQPNPVVFRLGAALKGATPAVDNLAALGKQVSLNHKRETMGVSSMSAGGAQATLLGLQEMLVYGLKGVCAYAHHAEMLGKIDPGVDDALGEALAFLASDKANDTGAVLAACMKLGETNFRVMQLLDEGHVTRFGDPTPTEVKLSPVKGKAILISGHDMADLEQLLEQTKGTGINVYTHGEMLPAHGYPGLRKYPHLVGNYGGAWYKQKKEFAEFPGAILMTTNCIVDPTPAYADRIFTTGEVGVAASKHIPTKDFSPVIKRAMELPGFTHEPEVKETATVGYGRKTVLGAAGLVIDAVKAGDLKHIFLVGGCDAAEPSRKYYSKVGAGIPKDALLLTLGCGKFRLMGQDYGALPNGLPRLLDMGQCNDAYGAIIVASELAKALGTDVNSLPLSLDISWLEQKAVAVLLTLLHLGIRNIRIGPGAPAFLTPEAAGLLSEKFGLKIADTKNPESEIQAMLAGH